MIAAVFFLATNLHAQDSDTFGHIIRDGAAVSDIAAEKLDRVGSRNWVDSANLMRIGKSSSFLKRKSFLLELIPGRTVLAKTAGFTEHETGDVTWVGRLGNDEELHVMTMGNTGLFGKLFFEGESYYIEPAKGQVHIISKIDHTADIGELNDGPVSNDGLTDGLAFRKSGGGSGNIEVLMVYTSAASSGISSVISSAKTDANTAISSSAGASGSVGIAFTSQVSITESGNLETDTSNLASNQGVIDLRN